MPPDDDARERDDDNPYERWDIDPIGGPAAITERMRALVEDAETEEARAAIRAAWEELTVHPARRLRAALGAHPDSHGPRGEPPPAPRVGAGPALTLALEDLALRPSVLGAVFGEPGDRARDAEPSLPDLPFDRDPILAD